MSSNIDKIYAFSRRYVFAYKWWYLGGALLVMATQGLIVAIIETIKAGIDAAAVAEATAATILPYVWSIIILALLLIAIRTSSRLMIFTPGRMVEYQIRNDYFSRLLFLGREFFFQHESGDLISRCSNDVHSIRAAYGFGILQIINVASTFCFGIGAMLSMDPHATCFLAIPIIFSFVVIQLSIAYVFKYWRLSNEQLGELSAFCLSSYKGIAVIQSYHAEPAILHQFNAKNQAYLDTHITVSAIFSFIMPMIRLVGGLSVLLVLWLVGPRVIAGQMTIGEITAFLGYIAMVMPPLLSLGWMLNVFQRSVPAIERMNEVLQAPTQHQPAQFAVIPASAATSLVAAGVSYHYDSGAGIANIKFQLPPGKVLGIVGPVGCGKTTLVETILRLNDVTSGQLWLAGKDAAAIDLQHYRSYFAFAPQQAFLFSDTLRNNLRLALSIAEWSEEQLDSRLEEYLSIAGFDLSPKLFPQGLDTQVGEKGIMLSGGQRQRIALARALLRQAQIYILDDVLSAVDHETERRIIANLRHFAADKSFIIVSHRISAISWADEILVIEDGRISARGTHQELLARSDYYREVFHYQSQTGEHGANSQA